MVAVCTHRLKVGIRWDALTPTTRVRSSIPMSSAKRSSMYFLIRLLFTILLCAVTSPQATAQNNVSRTLFGLGEDQRNETFTRLLQDNNAKCDRVLRTLFVGATSELDVWEALCRDGNSYSLTIPPESTAGIELVSCRELLATSKMLLDRAGSKSKPTGCRINE